MFKMILNGRTGTEVRVDVTYKKIDDVISCVNAVSITRTISETYAIFVFPENGELEITGNIEVTKLSVFGNGVEAIDIDGVESLESLEGGFSDLMSLKKFTIGKTPLLRNIERAWDACLVLEEINYVEFIDIEEASYAFRNCRELKKLGDLNLSAAEDAVSIFRNCYKLKSIGKLDISSADSLYNTFQCCYEIETIEELKLGIVKYMARTFKDCKVIKHNLLLGMNTSELDSNLIEDEIFTGSSFEGCDSL